MVKVKVCGIRDTQIVSTLNNCLPDFVGFILSQGFKRSVSPNIALHIREKLNSQIATVGVFVNESIEEIERLFNLGIFSYIQLHGDEDEKYIDYLKTRCSAKIIKSTTARDGTVTPYPTNCDYVLLDAYSPYMRGGTGKTVDWRRYEEVDKPLFLAGGITPQNVQTAIKQVQPFAVDCSGGVEVDGIKDAKKVEEYIKAARQI